MKVLLHRHHYLNPFSPPPSPSGALPPCQKTREDCSASCAQPKRWSAAICHPSGPWAPPGPRGVLLRLRPSPPAPDTPLRQEAGVYRDLNQQNATTGSRNLKTLCSWPHQQDQRPAPTLAFISFPSQTFTNTSDMFLKTGSPLESLKQNKTNKQKNIITDSAPYISSYT